MLHIFVFEWSGLCTQDKGSHRNTSLIRNTHRITIDPYRRATVVSYGEVVSYERGTPAVGEEEWEWAELQNIGWVFWSTGVSRS
jgi:hypothetical protein